MGVVKLADYRPQLEVVEHRVADTEDGFMRVANEITDSLLMADLTVRQLKVMLAIMRKTYGFNKPMDRLTNTQIAAMTGIHHTHVCAAKRQLIERKFLIADGVKIGVNKVVSQWISQGSLTLAKTANKTLAKSANGYKPSQLNTKDNIQKTINTNTPLPPNGGGDGQVKPERRKAERIDYESFLNAYPANRQTTWRDGCRRRRQGQKCLFHPSWLPPGKCAGMVRCGQRHLSVRREGFRLLRTG